MEKNRRQETKRSHEGNNTDSFLTFEKVNNSIPAFREDFPTNAGEIKQLTKEDLLNEHRRRHLESYCKSSSEWSNYEKRQKNDERLELEILSSFIQDLILISPKTKEEYEAVINTLRRRHRIAPSKAQIIRVYEEIMSQKGVDLSSESMAILYQNDDYKEDNSTLLGSNLEKTLLSKKAVRSQSGVVVITILTSPGAFSCKHDCHYCPNEPGQPRSYLSTEPAVLRANQNSFDAIKQFRDRSITLKNNGHIIDKIEVLVLGGTWSGYPKEYQNEFIRDIYYAANTFTNKNLVYENNDYIDRKKLSLSEEVRINQDAECRIIGLTLETRPDYITLDEILQLREFGCTRVQLGIQHTDYWVLKLINRGCYMNQIVRSIRLLKDTGYKVDIHLMPDLPNPYDHTEIKDFQLARNESECLNQKLSLLRKLQSQIGFDNAQTLGAVNDYLMLSNVLSNPKLQCDQWKLYPCEVVPFSKIEEWYENKIYMPYAEIFPDTLCYILLTCKVGLHPWIRVNRVIRDIPNQSIIAGNSCTNLRQMIHDKMKVLDVNCRCLRCREIKDKHIQNRQNQIINSNSTFINDKEDINRSKNKKTKKTKKNVRNKDGNLRNKLRDVQVVLRIRKYETFGGSEFFVSIETKDELDLYGFIRLRIRFRDEEVVKREDRFNLKEEIESQFYTKYSLDEFVDDSEEISEKFPVLKNSALIRELHIYGTVVPHYVNDEDTMTAIQHRGFGKTLLKTAEYLAYIHGFSNIAVISGVGVREYYANNGYFLQDTYMIKNIDSSVSISDEFEIHFLDCSLETDLFKTLNYIRSMECNQQMKNLSDNNRIPGLAVSTEVALEDYINEINLDIYDNANFYNCNSEEYQIQLKYDQSNNSIPSRIFNKLKSFILENKYKQFTWILGISIFTSSIFGLTYLKARRR